MSIRPNQKLGMETPNNEISVATVSTQVFLRMAEIVPSVTPKMTANSMADIASAMVDPASILMSYRTGRCVRTDCPKSP